MTDVVHQVSPGLIIVVAALVAGVIVALVRSRRDRATLGVPTTAADCEERLVQVLADLRELDERATTLTSEGLSRERAWLESEAARLMRWRDELARAPAAKPPVAALSPALGFLARHPQLKGALWGGGVVALGFGLFALAQTNTTVAPPKGPMAGPQASGGGAAEANPEVQDLLARLRAQPEDLRALLRLAHLLLQSQMLDEAQTLTDRALQINPESPEALVHAAVLKSTQDRTGALADLEKLARKNPTLAEAWLFRGMLAMQAGDTKVMQESLRQFVAVAPEGPQRERIRAMLAGSSNP